MDLSSSPMFPRLPEEQMRALLQLPDRRTKPLKVVIDTDLANEIDDFFAVAHLALAASAGEIRIDGVYAAPFSFRNRLLSMLQAQKLQEIPERRRSLPEQTLVDSYAGQIKAIEALGLNPKDFLYPESGAPDPGAYDHVAIGPEVGMARSFEAAKSLVAELGLKAPVLKGAPNYLQNGCPVRSEAVEHLIRLARSASTDDPIYVMGLACATNLASALLLAPDIRDRVVMTWTAGYPTNVTDIANTSFNLEQDVDAAQILFSSGVPLVYLPGFYIGQQLTLSHPDVVAWFQDSGALGQRLAETYMSNPLFPWYGIDKHELTGRIWNIWDLINGAWLIKPSSVASRLVRAPKLSDDQFWIPDPQGHLIRENSYTAYNAIFPEFIQRLRAR